MNHQGHPLGPEKIDKIRLLLETTDLDIATIAKRMGCSRGKVTAVNARYAIRNYSGHRNVWVVKTP